MEDDAPFDLMGTSLLMLSVKLCHFSPTRQLTTLNLTKLITATRLSVMLLYFCPAQYATGRSRADD